MNTDVDELALRKRLLHHGNRIAAKEVDKADARKRRIERLEQELAEARAAQTAAEERTRIAEDSSPTLKTLYAAERAAAESKQLLLELEGRAMYWKKGVYRRVKRFFKTQMCEEVDEFERSLIAIHGNLDAHTGHLDATRARLTRLERVSERRRELADDSDFIPDHPQASSSTSSSGSRGSKRKRGGSSERPTVSLPTGKRRPQRAAAERARQSSSLIAQKEAVEDDDFFGQ
jgi:hypothetical protein